MLPLPIVTTGTLMSVPLQNQLPVWSAAPKTTLAMLDSIQRIAIRLIGNETLTASLPPLQLRRDVGDLA